MRHIPESSLRRLVDEPFAVADAAMDHIAKCVRCRVLGEQIARDAAAAAALLSLPHVVPDPDGAWRQLQGSRVDGRKHEQLGGWLPRPRQWRLAVQSVPSKAALAGLAVLAVGTAAVAVLTIVGSPAKVPPGQVVSGDFGEIADFAGIDGSGTLGGFGTPSGSLKLPFGMLHWTSARLAYSVGSIAQARKATGLDLRLPKVLPSGVGRADGFLVQPEVTAKISFGAAAGRALNGTSLTITAGPAVVAEYRSSASSAGLPTLWILAMDRPTASSTRASSAQLEAFVLSRPGLPPAFAQDIRLLGDLASALRLRPPVGAAVTTTEVDGSPAVLVTDDSGAASGVVWEDRGGVVRAALGLLDKEDILNVANQLG